MKDLGNLFISEGEILLGYPVYVQIFEGCNFRDCHGQLAVHEIFILEISLAKLWLASIAGYL